MEEGRHYSITLRQPDCQHWIGGQYVPGSSGVAFDNFNPTNNEVICQVHQAGEEDVDRAVESALEGFEKWSAMKGAERGRIMFRAAQLLRERNEELAVLEVLDTGKPIQEAIVVDIISGAEAIEYFAGVAATVHGQTFQLGESWGYTIREPLGVCTAIGAWNYPIQIACWKSAPALACGNSVIFKPSELTPLTALKLAEIYKEAGLPDGVFNVVLGDSKTGQLLISHPDVVKVSLTGSVETGKRIMAAAAANLKHVTLELGGKSPLIIFEDANLDNAVSGAMLANFFTQGEVCSNGTRVFVHTSLYQPFLAAVKKRAESLIVGDPFHSATQMGPLISKNHLKKVMGYIAKGKDEGATLVCGGYRLEDNSPGAKYPFSKGNYVAPTIFTGCQDSMAIVTDEIFGPVMCILTFDDENEVISRANATRFGLAAGVFTQDLTRAHRVVRKLKAGTTWINNYNITPIELPFGGYKESGIGRENSLITVNYFTQVKSVYVEMGEKVASNL